MQVKKIFNISTKTVIKKPPYVKPKYKTYRQLLQLDRPKRIVEHQSDDQNDDFLEKLMKKQEKKQKQSKKKSKEKVSSGKFKNNSQNQNNSQIQAQSQVKLKEKQQFVEQKNELQTYKPRIPSAISNQNDHYSQQEYLRKKNQFELNEKNQYTLETNKLSQIKQVQNRKQSIKIVVRKRNSSQDNLFKDLQLRTNLKKKQQNNQMEENNPIKKYDKEANKIIKNNFLTSHKMKKMQGLKQLQKYTHPNKIVENDENFIQSKLNPQRKEIYHTISSKKIKNLNQISYSDRANQYLWKSASSTPVQMILWMAKSSNHLKSKSKNNIVSRKALFQTVYQQELFLKSLKNK